MIAAAAAAAVAAALDVADLVAEVVCLVHHRSFVILLTGCIAIEIIERRGRSERRVRGRREGRR